MLDVRASGVLLHPTSLPGPHAIGDLGPAAFRFAENLARARQRWWQMLPVGPPAGHSPYQCLSSFAGNPLLVSLEGLLAEGLLLPKDQPLACATDPERVDFSVAAAIKHAGLRAAFVRLEEAPPAWRQALQSYRESHREWIEDFALFCAIKKSCSGRSFVEWPKELRDRNPDAIEEARHRLEEDVSFAVFVQFCFFSQWSALRRRCKELGVQLLGDIPIFVAPDSTDVWAHPEIFRLAPDRTPAVLTGVPPDYFSADGQLWGNPHYNWPELKAQGYRWWIERFKTALEHFDAVRVDHFIGFHRAWEVQAGAKNAREGRWAEGPKDDFFQALKQALGPLPIVAEDLGSVTPEVWELRDRFELPGIKVLQFAFGPEGGENEHHPNRHPERAVVYTGTHDNDTTVGWFAKLLATAAGTGWEAEAARRQRDHLLGYLQTDGSQIHWDLIRAAMRSRAKIAIFPLQDLLGQGSELRMNVPGLAEGNWHYRFREEALSDALLQRLAALSEEHRRGG